MITTPKFPNIPLIQTEFKLLVYGYHGRQITPALIEQFRADFDNLLHRHGLQDLQYSVIGPSEFNRYEPTITIRPIRGIDAMVLVTMFAQILY